MPPRRTHTKSRNGCVNCKRRKVKCDESYPACFNCKRHQVPCSLSAGTPDESFGSSPSAPMPTQPNLLSPTPSSVEANGAPSPGDPPEVVPTLSDQIAPFPPHELEAKNLELMHHYCTVAADTLAVRKEMVHIWRVAVPREGYRNPFVMHGILAISAAHKAYLMPNNRKMYLDLSDYHQTVGSEGFRSALSNICPETWAPLFSFASVVLLYMFTLPNRVHDRRLPDPLHNFLELIGLLRGIKTTLAPIMPGVLRSDFAALVYGNWPLEQFGIPEGLPDLEVSVLPLDTWDAIEKLRAFMQAEVPASSVEVYVSTVDNLQKCAKLVGSAGVHLEPGAVLAWMYGIQESLLVDIGSHRPHALIILAYYCVFLATLSKSFWYARGWSSQLLNAIEGALSGQAMLLNMLHWPKQSLMLYELA